MRPKKRIIELAIREAEKSAHNFRLGAVIYKGKKIINSGFNQSHKTHPISKHPFSTIHAEVDAIIGTRREEMHGANIYVHRLLKNGNAGLAKPCRYCESLLGDIGIKRIYWSS